MLSFSILVVLRIRITLNPSNSKSKQLVGLIFYEAVWLCMKERLEGAAATNTEAAVMGQIDLDINYTCTYVPFCVCVCGGWE